MSAILFDEDPLMGTRTWFVPGEEGFHLRTEMNDDVLVANKYEKAFDNPKSTTRWKGDMHKVASIPMPLFMEMQKKGITSDAAEMKKWLNDPDNAPFRVKGGRV
jgi:hypothetical protein